jgi:hypothetical protein
VDLQRRSVVDALHGRASIDLGADDANHARLVLQRPNVVYGQKNPASGALAAHLQRRAAAPDDGDVAAQLFEDVRIAAAESLAGCRQNHDRDHAPQNPEHRQEAAQLVGAEVLKDLSDGFSHA